MRHEAALVNRHAAEIEPTRAGRALEEKRIGWAARLPRTAAELWGWLTGQEQTVILELLAYCVSQTVNAVQLPYPGFADSRGAWLVNRSKSREAPQKSSLHGPTWPAGQRR